VWLGSAALAKRRAVVVGRIMAVNREVTFAASPCRTHPVSQETSHALSVHEAEQSPINQDCLLISSVMK